MKCEKCNEREANFFYTATINGQTTQRHLCSQCAAEEGLDKALGFGNGSLFGQDMFGDFFRSPFGMLDEFFGRQGFFGGLMPTMTMPRTLFAPAEAPAQTPAQEASETKIPQDAGEEVRSRRELSALKHQLKEAVKSEDFEKAIELRDKIRELEK